MSKLTLILSAVIVILIAVSSIFLGLFAKEKTKVKQAKEETENQRKLNEEVGGKINESTKIINGNDSDTFRRSLYLVHNRSQNKLRK